MSLNSNENFNPIMLSSVDENNIVFDISELKNQGLITSGEHQVGTYQELSRPKSAFTTGRNTMRTFDRLRQMKLGN